MIFLILGILLILFAFNADKFISLSPESKTKVKNAGFIMTAIGALLILVKQVRRFIK